MKKYCLLYLFLFSLIFTCCTEQDEVLPEVPEPNNNLLSFSFLQKNNFLFLDQDYTYSIHKDHVNIMFPPGQKFDSLAATFISETNKITVDSILQVSDSTYNNFANSLSYTLLADDSTERQYQMHVHTYTEIPVLKINTLHNAPINSKEIYVKGHATLITNQFGDEDLSKADMEIRGRGNTSWEMRKKSYKLKLVEKEELLGMSADKSWVLLANYADKTLMRNYTAFEFSKYFGMAYTPNARFVEFYINGAYNGNYLLTEQVQIDDHRVNIHELEKKDISEDKISGGYLLEIDRRLDDDYWFITSKDLRITIKSPDLIADEQLEYITNYVQTTEDIIFSENFQDPEEGYAKYIDVESFINWYLVNEITKNRDAKFNSSVFMYKPRDGKLFMGPVWDFDIAMGNIDFSNERYPEGWHIRNATWYQRLFTDPAFQAKVKDRWNELMNGPILDVLNNIDKTAEYLDVSQRQNFNRWKILNQDVWPNPVVTGSYQGEINYMKTWLKQRIEWMNNEMNK